MAQLARLIQRRPPSGALGEEIIWGLVFALPWFVGFLAFKAGPILAALYLSFNHYDMLTPIRWAGIDNYLQMPRDSLMFTALYNTAYITLLGVPTSIAIAFALALLLDTGVRGLSFYRTFFYMPSITPVVASSLLWIWFLNPTAGPINFALELLGIPGPNWLASETWSKPAIVLMHLWTVGNTMVIFLAGLQGVPRHLHEAAAIDGADAIQRFIHVTVPQMTPTIFFTTIMGVIGHMQVFSEAYIMTKGGPLNSTLFYVYYLFNNGFAYFRMGYASALAWLLFVIILVLTYIQMVLAPRWVHYESDVRE